MIILPMSYANSKNLVLVKHFVGGKYKVYSSITSHCIHIYIPGIYIYRVQGLV